MPKSSYKGRKFSPTLLCFFRSLKANAGIQRGSLAATKSSSSAFPALECTESALPAAVRRVYQRETLRRAPAATTWKIFRLYFLFPAVNEYEVAHGRLATISPNSDEIAAATLENILLSRAVVIAALSSCFLTRCVAGSYVSYIMLVSRLMLFLIALWLLPLLTKAGKVAASRKAPSVIALQLLAP